MVSWIKDTIDTILQRSTRELILPPVPDPLRQTNTPVSGQLQLDAQKVKTLLSDSDDVVARFFGDYAAVYLEGCVDPSLFREGVIEKLERWFRGQVIPPGGQEKPETGGQQGAQSTVKPIPVSQVLSQAAKEQAAKEQAGKEQPAHGDSDRSTNSDGHPVVPDVFGITHPEAVPLKSLEHAAREVLSGSAAVFCQGKTFAVEVRAPGWPTRPVQDPKVEPSIRAAEDTFVEDLRPNVALLRRKVQDPALKLKVFTIGTSGRLPVAVAYIDRGSAPARADLVERRLRSFPAETVVELGYLRRALCPRQSLVPLVLATERPDRAAKLLYLERVVVMVQNFPNVLVFPVQFAEFLSTPDDAAFPPAATAFLALIRIVGAILALYAPSLYIAVIGYSPDILRLELTTFIAAERALVPLNALFEIGLLLILLEILLEATVRLPARVSAAGTVVGGLIIGQAIVRARLVSGMSIIVMAGTAVSSWVFTAYEMSAVVRTLQWILTLSATVLGLPGILLATFGLGLYINSLGAMGLPYLLPIVRKTTGPTGKWVTYIPAQPVEPWGDVQAQTKKVKAQG